MCGSCRWSYCKKKRARHSLTGEQVNLSRSQRAVPVVRSLCVLTETQSRHHHALARQHWLDLVGTSLTAAPSRNLATKFSFEFPGMDHSDHDPVPRGRGTLQLFLRIFRSGIYFVFKIPRGSPKYQADANKTRHGIKTTMHVPNCPASLRLA